ncbi:AEC family transporter [uncultured Kocuria sp.]|uniref:AEC family transporter n=1 Tax=uncultured Kocuria sp. TaxID=259305 RepID=UPI0025925213|nr:AEC family transporter [uncultured Kocuria sp.]MCT1367082.1 AEC family transporter [Rothia sp. p3-SID1597]
MIGVLEGFAIIGIVVGIGYLVERQGILGKGAGWTLNRFAFFVALPALMFTTLSSADLHVIFSARLPVAALSFVAMAAIYSVIVGLVMRRKVGRVTVGAVGSALLNANNMGLPVATYIFGDPSQVAPILLFQLILATPVCLAIFDVVSKGYFSFRTVATQPVRNPIIIGSLLGVVLNAFNVRVPDVIHQPLSLLGGAGIPLILVAFGMSLRGNRPLANPGERFETILAVVLKVALMPVAAYVLGRFVFDLPQHDLFAATALAGLPTAQNLFNFASRYNHNVPLARDIVLLSTVAAVPALLVIAALMT